MEKPKQVNVSRRLIFSFCVLILLFLLFGLFTLYENQITSRLARTIYNHPLIVSNAALQSNASIMKMHRDMKDVVLFESLSRIQQSLEAVNQQEQQVYQNLDIVRNKILGNEGKLLENEARILFDGWRPIREEVISLVRKDQRQKATEITIGKDADHVAKLEEKMLELTDYARNKASFFIREAEKSYSRANLSLIILLLSGLFVSSLIALFTLKYTASSEKELRESRQLIENAIDFAPIGLVLLKPDGNFFRVNQAFNDMIGYSEKELSKMTFQDITHPDDYDIGPEFIQKILRGDTNKASLEKRYVKKDGSIINVFLTTTLLKDNKDKPHYFFNQVQDITERKKIEEELRKSERLHREAQRVAKIGHWELNSPSGTPTWSEEIFHIFGLDPKKSGPSFAAHANIIHDEDWGLLDNSIQELSTNGTPFDLEFRIVLPNGEIRWMHAKGSADKSEDGSVTRMFGTAQDITERKQAELVMRESEKRLRALSFQLIDAQEKERRRISQELHDEMGQVLTAIVLNLTEIENQISSDQAQILKNIFADTHSLLDQTAHQIRELTYSLRPTMLDDLGLLPTLRWHLNSFTKRTDIAVNFETIALDDRMDATIETVLYRIAQESLNNIVKHADAKKVTVHLENKEKTVALSIEDDGKGFDINEINARRAREKKIGLLGMEERTALMGGKFLIQSQKGHGTQIFVEIPLYARGI